MRPLIIIAALAVLAAATHANVMHAGGYHSDGAPLAIALCALLAVGIAYAVTAWRDGARLLSALLGLCILSGEVYWIATNAERELAAREAQEAPAKLERDRRAAAIDRLVKAEAAKLKSDADAVSEAAKPGCAKNCADLLKDAKNRAETELAAARAAVEALPPARSIAALPERIGIASWAWDLIIAGLRSVAVVGASIALALALHPKRITENFRNSEMLAPEPKAIAAPVVGTVSRYLVERLKPAEGERTAIADLISGYKIWCDECGFQPIERASLVKEIARLFEKARLETEVVEGKVYALDAQIVA